MELDGNSVAARLVAEGFRSLVAELAKFEDGTIDLRNGPLLNRLIEDVSDQPVGDAFSLLALAAAAYCVRLARTLQALSAAELEVELPSVLAHVNARLDEKWYPAF